MDYITVVIYDVVYILARRPLMLKLKVLSIIIVIVIVILFVEFFTYNNIWF